MAGAGGLRHRVTLERRIQAADVGTGLTTSYTAVATVWAKVEAVRGGIYMAGLQVGEGPTHRIRIRYRAVTDFDFLSEGTRRWHLRDIRDPDGLRQWLDLMAEEQTP